MSNDSVKKTLIVAFSLCFFCSVLVSVSAVKLRPAQVENKKLDMKKNLLLASGILKDQKATKSQILEAFKSVKAEVVDLKTGNAVDSVNPETFDLNKAHNDPNFSVRIEDKLDIAKIKKRSKLSTVYKIIENGTLKQIVLPVHGKGLWSTLYGFIALSPDTTTILGLGFYQHLETPGLGGEIDNPKWKALWKGKLALDANYKPQIDVIKGSVDNSTPGREYKVDGLSGATITSNGVEALVNYWLGEDGFGTFLANLRNDSRGVN